MSHDLIIAASGLYLPLVFIHFFADWLTQTEKMAMEKRNHLGYLLLHCTIYSSLFMPVLYWGYDLNQWQLASAWLVLFLSHLVGDTGVVVWLWARFIRRMTYQINPGISHRVLLPEDFFKPGEDTNNVNFAFKPVFAIVIDQLWHLTFLWFIPIIILLKDAA